MNTRFWNIIVCVLLLVSISLSKKKNLVLFVGDGYGVGAKTALRMAMGQGTEGKRFSTDKDFQVLAADKLKYTAMVTTHSLNSWVTDSAPGGSAYACGREGKTDNGMLAFDAETGRPAETILEEAKKAGYAVGLVTTTRITHATPASFGSHVWNRNLENYIAAQYISKSEAEYEEIFNSSPTGYETKRDWILPEPKIGVEIDVLMGGGSSQFLPKENPGDDIIVHDAKGQPVIRNGNDTVTLGKGGRGDNINLLHVAESRGYVYVNSRDALLNLDLDQFSDNNNTKLIGLFNDSHLSYEQDRQRNHEWEPSLFEMARIAIKVLEKKSSKGFFLMVEGGKIDHLEHDNAGAISEEDGQYSIHPDVTAPMRKTGQKDPYTSANGVPLYGSDYLIKEALAFDYAIEEGRKLLSGSDETLLFSTSDHETGGTAAVALDDVHADTVNGANVRTYAGDPVKPKDEMNPAPEHITLSEVETGGWFPEYTLHDFQGTLWPEAPADGRRIIFAYASNPMMNGNWKPNASSIGNHTPTDIWVGADDNVSGKYASRLTGRGLLDNTDIFPIMQYFLGLKPHR